MEIFKVILGASRVEFSVIFKDNQYLGIIGETVIVKNVDYETMRSAIIDGMEQTSNNQLLH